MATFLQAQMDYIFFFYGLAFVLLGVVCLGLAHNAIGGLPWRLLGLFGLSHGLNEWFDLLAFSLGDSDTFRLVRLLVMALSFIFLLEFGRQGLRHRHPAMPGPWVYLLLFAFIALAGWVWGGAALNPAARYALGLIGGLAAGALLLMHGRNTADPDRRWLGGAGLAMALYGLFSGGVVPAAGFFPASMINHGAFFETFHLPVQLVRGILASMIAVLVWSYAQAGARRRNILPQGRRYFLWTVVALLLIIGAGWPLTEQLGQIYRQDLEREAHADITLLNSRLQGERNSLEGAVKALAQLPQLVPRLEQDSAEVRRMLEQFSSAVGACSAYILNVDGSIRITTLDSVENCVPLLLLPEDFEQLRHGNSVLRFLRDPGNGERGILSAAPIHHNGRMAGSAVLFKSIEGFELELERFGYSFLADPEGRTFLAGVHELQGKRLWGADGVLTRHIPAEESRLDYAGQGYRVHRHPTAETGWTLVLLKPERTTLFNRMFGIIIVFLLSAMTLIFFSALQREVTSGERLELQQQELERLNRHLELQATTDQLTGARNRRHFDQLLAEELARSLRYGHPLSLVMFDIDHFKAVNDTYGHQVGDEVLFALSILVQGHIRASDTLARWGGEEFMVLTPDSDLQGAMAFAEKLRQMIASGDFGTVPSVTCSFGVATLQDGESDTALTQRADAALYQAKESGRNRVCAAR